MLFVILYIDKKQIVHEVGIIIKKPINFNMTNNKIKVIYSNTIFNYEPLKSIKLPQNIYN